MQRSVAKAVQGGGAILRCIHRVQLTVQRGTNTATRTSLNVPRRSHRKCEMNVSKTVSPVMKKPWCHHCFIIRKYKNRMLKDNKQHINIAWPGGAKNHRYRLEGEKGNVNPKVLRSSSHEITNERASLTSRSEDNANV